MIRKYTELGFWGKGTFLDHFERNAERYPEKEYVVDVKGRVSFSKMSKIVIILQVGFLILVQERRSNCRDAPELG